MKWCLAATSAALLASCSVLPLPAARADVPATLNIDLSQPGPAIPPTFGGLMTEEINHSYDGGLYAELIQNRTFQDPMPRGSTSALPVHWSFSGNGKAAIDRSDPVNSALPVSLRLDLAGGPSSIANDGYWGIPIRPNTEYTVRFYAKGGGGFTGRVTAALVSDDGNVPIADASVKSVSGDWRKYTISFKTGRNAPTTTKAHFVLSATGSGSVSFSLVSLFPPTYQDAPNGLRPDLMSLMNGLRPAFIRLPGGNYLEGSTFATRFNWKQMIGPADQRPGHQGCWGYRSSDGFGLPEYLLWCQQLHAEPVLAVFAGYVLNREHVDGGSPEMAQYTQEALDEIEYVTGSATSEWGKKRVADGLKDPFTLHYVEVGNEDWFDRSGSYEGRFTEIAKAIRAKYPQLKIIATAPVTGFKPDLYDDHFYRSARQLMKQARQYDKTTGNQPLTFAGGAWSGRQPDGIKTFVGEWATQEGRPTPDVTAALSDAAFVMGLEQNADTVPIECYAPMFVNVNPADPEKGYPRAWQWGTNLIGYDALHSFGSPSYYAQAMLAQNRGDTVLSALLTVSPVTAAAAPSARASHGAIGLGTWHTQAQYSDLSVTGPNDHALLASGQSTDISQWKTTGGRWKVQDQAIQPSGNDSESWAMTGDPNWKDYTIRVRARKMSGQEGFIVLFHGRDGDNYRWWNVGGWGNTEARFEASENGDRSAYGPGAPFVVETGRWYNLRLEVMGSHVRGYVDDKLVTDVNEATEQPVSTFVPVISSATYASSDHAVLVKLVNVGDDPVDTAIHLQGVSKVDSQGTATVLAGDPSAMNSIERPTNVAPKQETLTGLSPDFHHTLPPHSLTILRLNVTPK